MRNAECGMGKMTFIPHSAFRIPQFKFPYLSKP